MNKDTVVRKVRNVMRYYHPDIVDHAGSCLYWAYAFEHVAKQLGFRAIIQAGTCVWPRLNRDDTYHESQFEMEAFGYVFEKDSEQTKRQLLDRRLPEMHVWNAIPETGEVVDLTTSHFPIQCQKLIGKDWPVARPPDYLWTDTPPARVTYMPDATAILLARLFALRLDLLR